ncbi:MAG: hypothetical protein WAO02_17240 [Verrucomicrobiia bacterium]
MFKLRIPSLLFAAVLGALTTGCRTYEQQNNVIQYWHQGAMTNAVVEAAKMADKNANNKDAVIWRLEQGAVLRGAGRYEESNKAFDKAQDKIDDYAQKAKVRLSQETGALLSNQAELDYEGRTYDGVMLNTYKALNYLQLGEPDKARVELIRAYQRQQDAVEANKKRIAKVQAEAAKSKDKATIEKAQQDPKLQAQMQGAYANLDNLKAYADYVNPFTVYLDGLFFMADAVDGSDLERARKSFERAVGFDPDNEYVKQDLAMVDGLIQGKPLPPTTFVIFETGCAPVRDQIRIDIPIFFSKVSYVGAAFPTLKPQGDYLPYLTVTAKNFVVTTTTTNDTVTTAGTSDTNAAPNGTIVTATSTTTTTDVTTATTRNITATTSPIASMDSVIGREFKNEMPVVITKTIASTVTKAVASYAASQAASQQNNWLAALVQISTAVYQVAVNIADERTWTTLPKEFQACHFPTPPDRQIELEAPGGGQRIPVTIADGTINLVYVKSITANSPLLVTQMKLK